MNYPNFKLNNQDCLTWLSSQREGSFQTIVLDPPYNVNYRYSQYRDNKSPHEYLFEQLLVLAKCERLLKAGGSLFYLNYPETAGEIWVRVQFLDKVEILPWVYHTHLGGFPLRRSSREWLWFSKGKPLINHEAFQGEYRNPEDPRIQARIAKGLKPGGYDWLDQEPIKNTSREKREHPCQVPESMVERFILGTSNPGHLIGDCYTGSGTTGICAIRHGRDFAGCEIDPAYLEVAQTAIQKEWEAKNGFPVEIRKAI